MKFKSKADPRWGFKLWVAICAGFVMAAAVTFFLLRFFPALSLLILISDFISLQVIVGLIWAWFGTDYVLEGELLLIRCGCFLWQVKVDEITAVSRLTDSSLAPALSADRINIQTSRGAFYISPEDKETFVVQLLKINTKILDKD